MQDCSGCIRNYVEPKEIQIVDYRNPAIDIPRPKVFMMPYDRNPHFLGRGDLLTLLRQTLQETGTKTYNHRVAIYGMGGVGKTQIAIGYVYEYRKEYDNIYWISASDQAILLSGFREIGEKMGCLTTGTEGLRPTEMAKTVLYALRLQTNWLLVIDNLDDVSVVDGFLPAMDSGGHTLITTRNPDVKAVPAEGLEVPVLEHHAGVELLRIRSEINEADVPSFSAVADEIVRELGYLALAIDHAAAFIRSLNLDISDFLPIFRESRRKVLSRDPTSKHTYPNSVAATFILSFNRVKLVPNYGGQASKLLQLFAFLNPDGILFDFLRAGSSGLSNDLREIVADKLTFHEALGLLQRFSLIGRSQGKDGIVIHRLIQAVMRDQLSKTELEQYSREVIDLCYDALPPNWDTQERRELWRIFQSQVIEPAFEAAKVPSRDAGITLRWIGDFLQADGKMQDSERLTRRAFEILLTLFGAEHPDTLTSMNNLASTYWQQGKLQDAADLQERVLEARRRTLGEEHPDTLTIMGNLASTYSQQGKLQDAADLEERVLEARRRTLGEEHPDTLASMNNLASTYWQQGKLQDAADLEERVLEARRRTLGEEHPDTLATMGNLALTYESLGRTAEAVALMQQSVDGSQKILGEKHPDTAARIFVLRRMKLELMDRESSMQNQS